VPDALALGAALVRLDSRLVPGHELACPKAGDEAQVFVGVDEHRGARLQGRGRIVQEKRQRLAAAGPVLQEVVREHTAAFRPQAARFGMRRGLALADVGKGDVEHMFIERIEQTQGLQCLADGGPIFDRPARFESKGTQQPLRREAPAEVVALGPV